MNGPLPLQDYEALQVIAKARDSHTLTPEDLPGGEWAQYDLLDFILAGDTYVFLVGRRREVRPRIGRA